MTMASPTTSPTATPTDSPTTLWLTRAKPGGNAVISRADHKAVLLELTSTFAPLLGEHTVASVVDHQLRAGGTPHDVAERSRRQLAEILANF